MTLASAAMGQTAEGDLSVEEILRTQITSVGRKAQEVAKAPAAVYVMTQEDIRRSGATNLPDLLRIVPGLVVARINGSTWAISARGEAWQFSNKMLVMIDGRSVYGRLFSGVFWNGQDVLLEDIDRIEVIRGPGAVMWGSNAVNGVISIITKKAQATQGGLLTVGTGTEEQGIGAFRYGGRIGEKAAYRVWGRFDAREFREAGTAIYRPDSTYGEGERGLIADIRAEGDTGKLWRTGFRLDWERSGRDTVTVLGDLYGQRYAQSSWLLGSGGRVDQLLSRDRPWGGSLLGRWSRAKSADQETTMQFWADHSTQSGALYDVRMSSADGEIQHRRMLTENNELHVGGGYRRTADSIASATFRFRRPRRSDGLWNGVIRDEQQCFGQKLTLSAGVRGEHNAYTGFEVQPSVRLLFTPTRQQGWWVAWSRAVRTPSRAEHDTDTLPIGYANAGGYPVLLQARGNTGFVSERVRTTELGFRYNRRQRWSADVALFRTRYTRLNSVEKGELRIQTEPVFDIRQDVVFSNGREGVSWGGEASLGWDVAGWWRVHGSYSYLKVHIDHAPGYVGIEGPAYGQDPGRQVKLRSLWSLGRRLQLDTSVYAVDRVRQRQLPGYARVDVRLGWRPTRTQEWSVVGQDLFNNGRLEWQPDLYVYTIPTRSAVVIRWTLQF
jgi:iron complex outermembrane receptor protein